MFYLYIYTHPCAHPLKKNSWGSPRNGKKNYCFNHLATKVNAFARSSTLTVSSMLSSVFVPTSFICRAGVDGGGGGGNDFVVCTSMHCIRRYWQIVLRRTSECWMEGTKSIQLPFFAYLVLLNFGLAYDQWALHLSLGTIQT